MTFRKHALLPLRVPAILSLCLLPALPTQAIPTGQVSTPTNSQGATVSPSAPASSGVTLRVIVPPDTRAVVKSLRIAGAYNDWKVPQPMVDRGNGVFEYTIVNPQLNGQTVQYRLYPGGGSGWDGAEGPDAFKRTFDYVPNREVVLTNILFGSLGLPADSTGAPPVTVMVDDSRKFQTIEGFGAALTDSSAWLIGKASSPERQQNLLHTLFDSKVGAGLSYIRLPIGASDFSLTEHTYDDLPAGQTDYDLKHFSIAYDQAYIIPVLKQIMALNPHLKVMASPWSAPAWLKESGKLNGGRLKSDDASYAAYADYLLRFVQSYAAVGVPIDMLTLQNEPQNQTGGYPSMGMKPADEIRLAKLLGARFQAGKIATKIVVWDHNWDHPEFPIAVLSDPAAQPYIDGAAFHGYAGDVSAQLKVHDAFPDKNLYFTESTGGTFATNFGSNLMWDMQNLLVGATRNYAKTVLKWNLVLDEKNGPHLPGGPDNCRGIVTLNRQTGAITREEEFYAFAHAARFVQPGARRIYTNTPASVAFINPDASTALLLFNPTYNTQRYHIQSKGQILTAVLSPRSVATLLWHSDRNSLVQVWLTTGDQSKLLERQPDLRFQ